jgi:valyl-tRNA synthetase
MPYITEQLWQAIPHRGEALIVAPWPEASGPRCKEALRHWGGTLCAVVTAVRQARSEYQVDFTEKVAAVIVAGQADVREALVAEGAAICSLAKIKADTFRVRAIIVLLTS